MTNDEIHGRLFFILHRSLVEARLLAQAKNSEQLFDLVDAFETLPGYMNNWNDRYLDNIRFNLKKYRTKYPSPSFDYIRYLDIDPQPEQF